MTKYLIVIEKADGNYGAYLPDVPGCVAAADTIEETRNLIEAGLALHFEAMAEDGDPIPQPTSTAEYIEVAVPTSAKAKAS